MSKTNHENMQNMFPFGFKSYVMVMSLSGIFMVYIFDYQ